LQKKQYKATKDVYQPMTTTTTSTTGMVKWFDSKGGFGFITILPGEPLEGKDIFVHYSSLAMENAQYKYLVLGEYVEFTLVKSTDEKYEYTAKDVRGLRGGHLMCESRRLASLAETKAPPPTPAPETPIKRKKPYQKQSPPPVLIENAKFTPVLRKKKH